MDFKIPPYCIIIFIVIISCLVGSVYGLPIGDKQSSALRKESQVKCHGGQLCDLINQLCQNGGECITLESCISKCKCTDDYEGIHCEKKKKTGTNRKTSGSSHVGVIMNLFRGLRKEPLTSNGDSKSNGKTEKPVMKTKVTPAEVTEPVTLVTEGESLKTGSTTVATNEITPNETGDIAELFNAEHSPIKSDNTSTAENDSEYMNTRSDNGGYEAKSDNGKTTLKSENGETTLNGENDMVESTNSEPNADNGYHNSNSDNGNSNTNTDNGYSNTNSENASINKEINGDNSKTINNSDNSKLNTADNGQSNSDKGASNIKGKEDNGSPLKTDNGKTPIVNGSESSKTENGDISAKPNEGITSAKPNEGITSASVGNHSTSLYTADTSSKTKPKNIKTDNYTLNTKPNGVNPKLTTNNDTSPNTGSSMGASKQIKSVLGSGKSDVKQESSTKSLGTTAESSEPKSHPDNIKSKVPVKNVSSSRSTGTAGTRTTSIYENGKVNNPETKPKNVTSKYPKSNLNKSKNSKPRKKNPVRISTNTMAAGSTDGTVNNNVQITQTDHLSSKTVKSTLAHANRWVASNFAQDIFTNKAIQKNLAILLGKGYLSKRKEHKGIFQGNDRYTSKQEINQKSKNSERSDSRSKITPIKAYESLHSLEKAGAVPLAGFREDNVTSGGFKVKERANNTSFLETNTVSSKLSPHTEDLKALDSESTGSVKQGNEHLVADVYKKFLPAKESLNTAQKKLDSSVIVLEKEKDTSENVSVSEVVETSTTKSTAYESTTFTDIVQTPTIQEFKETGTATTTPSTSKSVKNISEKILGKTNETEIMDKESAVATLEKLKTLLTYVQTILSSTKDETGSQKIATSNIGNTDKNLIKKVREQTFQQKDNSLGKFNILSTVEPRTDQVRTDISTSSISETQTSITGLMENNTETIPHPSVSSGVTMEEMATSNSLSESEPNITKSNGTVLGKIDGKEQKVPIIDIKSILKKIYSVGFRQIKSNVISTTPSPASISLLSNKTTSTELHKRTKTTAASPEQPAMSTARILEDTSVQTPDSASLKDKSPNSTSDKANPSFIKHTNKKLTDLKQSVSHSPTRTAKKPLSHSSYEKAYRNNKTSIEKSAYSSSEDMIGNAIVDSTPTMKPFTMPPTREVIQQETILQDQENNKVNKIKTVLEKDFTNVIGKSYKTTAFVQSSMVITTIAPKGKQVKTFS